MNFVGAQHGARFCDPQQLCSFSAFDYLTRVCKFLVAAARRAALRVRHPNCTIRRPYSCEINPALLPIAGAQPNCSVQYVLMRKYSCELVFGTEISFRVPSPMTRLFVCQAPIVRLVRESRTCVMPFCD